MSLTTLAAEVRRIRTKWFLPVDDFGQSCRCSSDIAETKTPNPQIWI